MKANLDSKLSGRKHRRMQVFEWMSEAGGQVQVVLAPGYVKVIYEICCW